MELVKVTQEDFIFRWGKPFKGIEVFLKVDIINDYLLFLSQIKTIKLKYFMNYPAELKYTSDHEWLRVEGDTAYIGVTDFAQSELGDIVFIEINTVGQTVAKGEIFGTVEAVKTVSDLYIPVTGEVLEVNPALDGTPELVNNDPYGEGWMVKIKIIDASELSELLSVEEYQKTL